jgi:hypothetical protein
MRFYKKFTILFAAVLLFACADAEKTVVAARNLKGLYDGN